MSDDQRMITMRCDFCGGPYPNAATPETQRENCTITSISRVCDACQARGIGIVKGPHSPVEDSP